MMTNLDFYRNKKVLVTGNTGFKGAWLTLWLLKLGAKVAGFSIDVPTKPALFEIFKLENKIQHYWGDVGETEQVLSVFHDFQPEVVFHLAAQPIVQQAYKDPKTTFHTNAMGTLNILEAIKQTASVKLAVLITSDKCYENVEWPYGYREIDRLGGKDFYSASKACAELIVHAYWHSHFSGSSVKIATARAGNVVGGGDWATNRLVPDIVRAWVEKKKLEIRNPHATRPWQHVLEPISGYLCLGSYLNTLPEQTKSISYNFGPKEETVQSVSQFISSFEQFWHLSQSEVIAGKKIKEASLLKLDCSQALQELHWRAVLNFSETIEFTAKWYQQYYGDTKELEQYTIEQIDQYIRLAEKRGLPWAAAFNH